VDRLLEWKTRLQRAPPGLVTEIALDMCVWIASVAPNGPPSLAFTAKRMQELWTQHKGLADDLAAGRVTLDDFDARDDEILILLKHHISKMNPPPVA